MLEFIEYPKCTTCKKAKKELDQLGLEYKDVHIVEETPSEEVILNWLETSGFELKQFFNTSGIKYRELGLKDKVGTLSNKEAAKLLAGDGMLLKRPKSPHLPSYVTLFSQTPFKRSSNVTVFERIMLHRRVNGAIWDVLSLSVGP